MKNKRVFALPLLCLAIAAFLMISPEQAQSETIYIFANMNVADSALTQNDIQNIYLGKKDQWNDNQRIHFTALKNGPCYESFVRQYVGRSPFQFQNYWKRQIFTGKGQPPRGFDSPSALVDYVSRTSGAIGYSCTPPDSGKVKTLTIN